MNFHFFSAWPFLGIHCFAYGLCPTDDRSYVRRPSAFSTIGLGMMAFMKGVRRRFSSINDEEIDYIRMSVGTEKNTMANIEETRPNIRRSTISAESGRRAPPSGIINNLPRNRASSFQMNMLKRRVNFDSVKRVRFADQQGSDENETSEIGERIARKLKKRLIERKLRQEVCLVTKSRNESERSIRNERRSILVRRPSTFDQPSTCPVSDRPHLIKQILGTDWRRRF